MRSLRALHFFMTELVMLPVRVEKVMWGIIVDSIYYGGFYRGKWEAFQREVNVDIGFTFI